MAPPRQAAAPPPRGDFCRQSMQSHHYHYSATSAQAEAPLFHGQAPALGRCKGDPKPSPGKQLNAESEQLPEQSALLLDGRMPGWQLVAQQQHRKDSSVCESLEHRGHWVQTGTSQPGDTGKPPLAMDNLLSPITPKLVVAGSMSSPPVCSLRPSALGNSWPQPLRLAPLRTRSSLQILSLSLTLCYYSQEFSSAKRSCPNEGSAQEPQTCPHSGCDTPA